MKIVEGKINLKDIYPLSLVQSLGKVDVPTRLAEVAYSMWRYQF